MHVSIQSYSAYVYNAEKAGLIEKAASLCHQLTADYRSETQLEQVEV
jgi:hypothetical protein